MAGINQSALTIHQPHSTLHFLLYHLGQICTLWRLNYYTDPMIIPAIFRLKVIWTIFPALSLSGWHISIYPDSPDLPVGWEPWYNGHSSFPKLCFGMSLADFVFKNTHTGHLIKLKLKFCFVQRHFYCTQKIILHSVLPRALSFFLVQ